MKQVDLTWTVLFKQAHNALIYWGMFNAAETQKHICVEQLHRLDWKLDAFHLLDMIKMKASAYLHLVYVGFWSQVHVYGWKPLS